MTDTQSPPKPALTQPIPRDDLSTGKLVWVLYWQFLLSADQMMIMASGADRGRWESIDAHVVSVGDLVCVQLSINSLPADWVGAFPAPHGSFLRFVDPKKCFASQEDARRFIQENPGTAK